MSMWTSHKNSKVFERPVSLHSLLLALEPRQVFDAAVGAAIAEVMAPPPDHHDATAQSATQTPAEHQAGNQAQEHPAANHDALLRLTGGAADSGLVRDFAPPVAMADGVMGILGGNAPMFSLDGNATIPGDTAYSLANISIIDFDAADTHTFTLTTDKGSFAKIAGGPDARITIGGGGKVLTFTGMTASEISAALPNYEFAMAQYQNGTATVIYSIDDPMANLVEGYFEVKVTPVNHDPLFAVDQGDAPGKFPATLKEGVTTTLKGLSVADVDGDKLRVTIHAQGGKFNIGELPGVTVNGRDSATLTLEGTAGQINSLLGTLNYYSSQAGEVTFTFSVSDEDPSTHQYHTDVSRDYVVKVNDPPTLTLDRNFTGTLEENSSIAHGNTSLSFSGLQVGDRNPGDKLTLELTLKNGQGIGQLYCAYGVDPAVWALSGDGQSLIITAQDVAVVQAILNQTTFKGNPNAFGDLKFSVKVTDSLGDSVQLDDKVISVTPINDAPIVAIPTDHSKWLAVFEGGTEAFNLNNFGITDIDTPKDKVIITIQSLTTQGRLYRGGAMLGVGASFSLADIEAGQVKYVHGMGGDVQVDPRGERDHFTFTVDDGSGGIATTFGLDIKLNPINNDFSVTSARSGTELVDGAPHNIMWVWERQVKANLVAGQGSPNDVVYDGGLKLNNGDDGSANFLIKIDSAPKVGGVPRGQMILDLPAGLGGPRVLNDGDTFYGDQLQYLRYTATDNEPGDGQPVFKLTFTDRSPVGGMDRSNPDLDASRDSSISHTYDFVIKIAPNNDDPILDANKGIGTTTNREVINAVDSRFIPITPDLLKAIDIDSGNEMLTFTVKTAPQYGQLLLRTGTDGGGNPTFAVIQGGVSFTQKDITDGKIYFEYLNTGSKTWEADGVGAPGNRYLDLDTAFVFTVMDGGVTSWPDTTHKGGIYGNYGPDNSTNPYAPNMGEAQLLSMDFGIHLRVYERTGTDPGTPVHPNFNPQVTIDPGKVPFISETPGSGDPIFGSGDPKAPQYPSTVTLTGRDYSQGGGYSPSNGVNGMINIYDEDTPPDALVLSLLNNPEGGTLMIDRGAGFTKLFVGDKFTYAELLAGKVRYSHGGGEFFQEDLRFSVSDGFAHVTKTSDTNQTINLHLNIIPYNDGPGLSVDGSRLVVDEGGTLVMGGGWLDESGSFAAAFGFNDIDASLTSSAYKPLYDKDGNLRGGAFTGDPLTFVITSLPGHGSLQVSADGNTWVPVVLNGQGEYVVTRTQLENGYFRYVHDGTENFSDSFIVKARDNSTETGGSKDSAPLTVNIQVRSVNDAPVMQGVKTINGIVSEGQSIAIGGKAAVQANMPGLWSTDADNADAQIMYVIREACKYGTLYRKEGGVDVPLGRDSYFTQAELDAGLIFYQDNGKNQHIDSFKFEATDGCAFAAGGVRTFDIIVTPVNQDPAFTGVTLLDVWYEDSQNPLLILDPDAADQANKFIQIRDPDAEDYITGATRLNDYMEVTIAAHQGAVNGGLIGSLAINDLTGLGGLDITNVADSGTMTLKGTLADINLALSRLTFQATSLANPDLNETVYLLFNVNDCNNGGLGDHTTASPGALTAPEKIVRVHVSPLNDAPTANIPSSGGWVFWEDEPGNIFASNDPGKPNLVFGDADAFDIRTNTAVITANIGSISYTGLISADLNVQASGSGIRLTGTLAAINEALNHLRYQPTANYNGPAVITVVYDDHGNTGKTAAGQPDAKSVTRVFDIAVKAVNDRPQVETQNIDKFQISGGKKTPTLEIDGGAQLNAAMGRYELSLAGKIKIDDSADFSKNFGIDAKPIKLTLTAKDKYTAAGVGLFVTAGAPGVIDFSGIPGLSVVGLNSSSITFTGTWTQVRAALDMLNYSIAAADANGTLVNIDVAIDDQGNGDEDAGHKGNNNTATTNFLVNINVENDPPTISGHDIIIYEDMYGETDAKGINLAKYMQAQGSPLAVADSDSFLNKVCYSIKVNGGHLWLDGVDRGTEISEYLLDKSNMTLWLETGKTVSEINTIFAKLYFKPDADWNGAITLTITINDKGNTGVSVGTGLPAGSSLVGDTLETVKAFTITVMPVNDVPTVGAGQTKTLAPVNEEAASVPGESVSELFKNLLADAKDTAGQAGSLAGVLIVGDGSLASQGYWEYSVDGGTNWTKVTSGAARSSSNALYLDINAKLRFAPVADFHGEPGKLTAHLVESMPVKAPYGLGGTNLYPALISGGTINMITGFDGIAAEYRPYTANTVLLATNIDPINDAPVMNRPASYTVNEDGTLNLTGLSISDADIRPTEGKTGAATYVLTVTATNGLLNAAVQAGVTVTGANTATMTFTGTFANLNSLLTGNKITYKPTADYYGAAQVSLTINDGGNIGTGGMLTDTEVVNITVNPVNDAPLVTGGGKIPGDVLMPFASIAEGTAATEGKSVADIFEPHYGDLVDNRYGGAAPDVAAQHTFAGILITHNYSLAAEGSWQYSTDSGATWTNLPSITPGGTALYLDKTAQLRFAPTAEFNGQAGQLNVRLVDSTTGLTTTGVTVPMPPAGGITPYSGYYLGLTIAVTALNDAPVWQGVPLSPITVAEDSPSASNTGSTVASILSGRFDDSKDQQPQTLAPSATGGSTANTLAGVLITGMNTPAAQGTWQYSTNNGASWSDVTLSAGQALLLDTAAKVRFTPAADYCGAPTGGLTINLVDSSGGAVTNGLIATPAMGGTTRYSDVSRLLAATVTPVNDAPIASGVGDGALLNMNEDAAVVPKATVANLFAGNFNDAKDDQTAKSGSNNQNNLAGVLITNISATVGQGVWQYSTNGIAWITITQNMFLDSNVEIRFNPAADFNGTPGKLTVRLVEDGNSYTPGVTHVNGQTYMPATGGTSRYSVDTVDLTISVAAVNDRPQTDAANAPKSIALQAAPEDGVYQNGTLFANTGETIAALYTPVFTDARDSQTGNAADGSTANTLAGVVITKNYTTDQGVWEYKKPGDAGWTSIAGNLSDTDALYLAHDALIRFVPATNFYGQAPKLEAHLVETLSFGTPETLVSGTQINDIVASTRFGTAIISLDQTVNLVNDAPTIVPGKETVPFEPAGVAEDTLAPTNGTDGHSVRDLFEASFNDSKDKTWGAANGGNAFAGVLVTGYTPDSSVGVWKFWNGSTW